MGLFAKIKALFNKNIELEDDISHLLIYKYKKSAYIYVEHNIIVNQNQNAIIVYKGKVCDVIMPGKFKITESLMPNLYKRAKVLRYYKKGIKIKKIKADIYFINFNKLQKIAFNSLYPLILKDEEFGKVRVYSEGSCNILINDTFAFAERLLSENSLLSEKLCRKVLNELISSVVNRFIEKSGFSLQRLISNTAEINSYVADKIGGEFDDVGFTVSNIILNALQIPKKIQEKLIRKSPTIEKRVVIENFEGLDMLDELITVNVDKMNQVKYAQKNDIKKSKETPHIGHKIEVCVVCGNKINVDDVICKNCGAKIK